MMECLDVILSCAPNAISEYNRKKDTKNKVYYYTRFKNDINKIINKKNSDESIKRIKLILIFVKQLNSIKYSKKSNTKRTYSDSDIEFLKQFSGFDLTFEEAMLVGKQNEYYNALRLVSNNGILRHDMELQKYIDSINEDYTPRLIYEFIQKQKNKAKQ